MHKILFFFAKIYWFIFRPRTYGVKCIILHNKEILLIKNSYGENIWNIPGGGIHKGEFPEEAAKREISEEVGVTLSEVRPIGEFLSTKHHKRDSVFCFVSRVSDKKANLESKEIKKLKWFSLDDLPKDRSFVVDKTLSLLKSHEK